MSLVPEGFYITKQSKNIKCKKIATDNQKADYLTKGMYWEAYCHCRKLNQGW